MIRRAIPALLLLATLASPAPAQFASVCPGVARALTPYAHETLTVSNSAVTLTSATYGASGQTPVLAELRVDAGMGLFRYWTDGTTPTASVGSEGSAPGLNVCGPAIKTIKLIRESTDVTIYVTYYKLVGQ